MKKLSRPEWKKLVAHNLNPAGVFPVKCRPKASLLMIYVPKDAYVDLVCPSCCRTVAKVPRKMFDQTKFPTQPPTTPGVQEAGGCDEIQEAENYTKDLPVSFKLVDAEERNRQHPTTFHIPTRSQREGLHVGDCAKLTLEADPVPAYSPTGDRLWFRILPPQTPGYYLGELLNTPASFRGLAPGDVLGFKPEHIADLEREGDAGGKQFEPGYTPPERGRGARNV